jgi:hypothetical protein
MRTEIHVYGGRKVYVDFDEYDLIRQRSPVSINDRIEEEIANSIRIQSRKDQKDITSRIRELDQEWDLDRTLTASLASGALISAAISSRKYKKWIYLSLIQLSFLTFHCLRRWSPLSLILRQFRFRSKEEISSEKYALKALRGDYNSRVA